MVLTDKKVKSLELEFLKALETDGISPHGASITVVSDTMWACSARVPTSASDVKSVDKKVTKVLEKVGANPDYVVYLGTDDGQVYEWFFLHPETPQGIIALLEGNGEDESDDESAFPVPKARKVKGDSCFLVLQKGFYDDIARGVKTVEYRTLNQYYCDKFFGHDEPLRQVKFQMGYNVGADGKATQMTYEVKDILLVNDANETIPARDEDGNQIREKDVPEGFNPTMYGLVLGKRLDA